MTLNRGTARPTDHVPIEHAQGGGEMLRYTLSRGVTAVTYSTKVKKVTCNLDINFEIRTDTARRAIRCTCVGGVSVLPRDVAVFLWRSMYGKERQTASLERNKNKVGRFLNKT